MRSYFTPIACMYWYGLTVDEDIIKPDIRYR